MKKIISHHLILIGFLICGFTGIAQPYSLDEKVKPEKLELFTDKDNEGAKGIIKNATVVEKPKRKAKNNSQNRLPFFAKAKDKFSPIGNRPISNPSTNNMSPKTTKPNPTNNSVRLGKGCCNTTI